MDIVKAELKRRIKNIKEIAGTDGYRDFILCIDELIEHENKRLAIENNTPEIYRQQGKIQMGKDIKGLFDYLVEEQKTQKSNAEENVE